MPKAQRMRLRHPKEDALTQVKARATLFGYTCTSTTPPFSRQIERLYSTTILPYEKDSLVIERYPAHRVIDFRYFRLDTYLGTRHSRDKATKALIYLRLRHDTTTTQHSLCLKARLRPKTAILASAKVVQSDAPSPPSHPRTPTPNNNPLSSPSSQQSSAF
jgi:hypothetical protein